MGTWVEMQPLMGCEVDGTDESGGDITQLSPSWLDLKDAEEVALSISVLDRWPATIAMLRIQTAVVPEGPWTTAVTLSGSVPFPSEEQVYLAAKEGAGCQFQRYLRWQLYTETEYTQKWGACFKIDALVR